MSNKGGRGKKAPYETTHCRVPLPLKALIELFSDTYKDLIARGENCEELLETVEGAISEIVSPSSGKKYREKALRAKLARCEEDRDKLLIRLSETHKQMLEEIKKAQEDANKKNEQLEAYNHKIDRANGYLEAENRRLRKQLETAC